MPNATTVTLGDCAFEILADGDAFVGVGAITIGGTRVRSGRLPMRPTAQGFQDGLELRRLVLRGIERGTDRVRVRLAAEFARLEVKLMRDHSFDPIHDLADWAGEGVAKPAGTAELDLVIEPASDAFNGVAFAGFAYRWEYASADTAIHWLMDKASWELDGDIRGATVFNQSACSAPVATFAEDTAWSTEGFLFWIDPGALHNRCMTHNLPRWTDHQCFDFQWKGDRVLLGVYERVDLIRTVLTRDAGKPELKCFDKHLFDEAKVHATPAKRILLRRGCAGAVEARNWWTWVYDDCHARARAESGLKEHDPVPVMGHHHWANYTIETYYKDILPACAAVGIRAVFAENFKRSDVPSEPKRLHNGNMCSSHEYEMADYLGGTAKFKEWVDRANAAGVRTLMWTNTYVSLNAAINAEHRIEKASSWFMAMEDTRLKYAGAYTCVSSNLDFKNPDARRWWVACHAKIKADTGLAGFFIDSHYNLFFMPVNYKGGHPTTVWRESLMAMKELQDAGVDWAIESFGPFGMNLHGHSSSYDASCAFIAYHVGYGNDYVTVPIPGVETDKNVNHDPGYLFYALAHKVPIAVPLFIDGKRIDAVYGDAHRRVLADYHRELPNMRRRYLQDDGNAVLWHDDAGTWATIWNFTARDAALPGTVVEVATGIALPRASVYHLEARRVYAVTGVAALPTRIGAPAAAAIAAG